MGFRIFGKDHEPRDLEIKSVSGVNLTTHSFLQLFANTWARIVATLPRRRA